MASRLRVLGFFVVVLGGCQKDREGVSTVAAASGTAISAAGNGSGGAGGAGGATSSTSSITGEGGGGVTSSTGAGPGPAASSGGDGGDPTGAGGAPATTGTGGGSSACGQDVECWGDEASLCDSGICGAVFVECSPGDPSPFRTACGNLFFPFRSGVWAHVVDCLRAVGPDVECSDGDAAVQACIDEASAQACGTAQIDDICDGAEVSCPGFDVDACRAEAPLYVQEQTDYYETCVETGGDCATLHNLCLYGEPNP